MKGKIIIGILALAASGGIVGGLLYDNNVTHINGPQTANTLLEDRITTAELKIKKARSIRSTNTLRVARMSIDISVYKQREKDKWNDVEIALNKAKQAKTETTISDLETKVDDAIDATPCTGGITTVDGYRVCLTDLTSFSEEVLKEDIPLKDQKRKVVCCDWEDENKNKHDAVFTDSASEPACVDPIIIDDNMTVDVSMPNITTELDKNAMKKCCTACPEKCWVRGGGNWGACPTCLCNGSCADYCPQN